MRIPTSIVHRAANAIYTGGDDVSQTLFEDTYHCRFGKYDEPDYYWLHFDSEQYATEFLLRWM